MTTKRKSKKGTGQHVISNDELKKLLQKDGHLPKDYTDAALADISIGDKVEPPNG